MQEFEAVAFWTAMVDGTVQAVRQDIPLVLLVPCRSANLFNCLEAVVIAQSLRCALDEVAVRNQPLLDFTTIPLILINPALCRSDCINTSPNALRILHS